MSQKIEKSQDNVMLEKAAQIESCLDFGVLFNGAIEKLEPVQAVVVWAMADLLSDVSTARKEELRLKLLDLAKKMGAKTEKGHFVAEIDGNEVINEIRVPKLPAESYIRELFEKRGIPIAEGFTETKTYKMDPSKIDYLIDTGKLTKEEVEAGIKTVDALKVHPSPELKDVLDRVTHRLGSIPPAKQLKGK